MEKIGEFLIDSGMLDAQDLNFKSLVIIFHAFVKTPTSAIQTVELYCTIVKILLRHTKKIQELDDIDFSDLLFCLCKERSIQKERMALGEKHEILRFCFDLLGQKIPTLPLKILAKVLNCLMAVEQKSVIPGEIITKSANRILTLGGEGRNRELCNSLIFFYEISYPEPQLFDFIYKNLLENQDRLTVMDLETLLYCLSGTDSQYRDKLLKKIQDSFLDDPNLTKRINGSNYEKIFMGICKNFLGNTGEPRDTVISDKLV
jgi:hypothetical protein